MSTGGLAPSLASWVTRARRLYRPLTHGTRCTLQVHHQRWSPENLEALPWPAVARVSKCPTSTKNWIKAEPSGLTSRYGLNTFKRFYRWLVGKLGCCPSGRILSGVQGPSAPARARAHRAELKGGHKDRHVPENWDLGSIRSGGGCSQGLAVRELTP